MNAPLLRKGSVVTPQTLLDDKLDILAWECEQTFITPEDYQRGRWAIITAGSLLKKAEGVSV